MLFQEGLDGVAELASTFSVNETQFVNSALGALLDEFKDHFLYVLRAECVKIENPIDWQLNWFTVGSHE